MDAAGEFRQSFFWLRLTLPLAGQAFYRKTMLEDFYERCPIRHSNNHVATPGYGYITHHTGMEKVLISQECPCSVDEDNKDENAQILREVRMRWFRYVKRWWEDVEKRICERFGVEVTLDRKIRRGKGNGDQRGLQGDESNPHQYGGNLGNQPTKLTKIPQCCHTSNDQ
ncbi:hypothetical protein H5410_026270 [Solanum commersonii]|uniref:Uncharacterized protein n=1 Tax=Solanum commersonii TaxID=4109 RepID=A0A9J5YWJ8_SOLCO|nr:hypothetical protein H5410_026270 [Solanum commersonii]